MNCTCEAFTDLMKPNGYFTTPVKGVHVCPRAPISAAEVNTSAGSEGASLTFTEFSSRQDR